MPTPTPQTRKHFVPRVGEGTSFCATGRAHRRRAHEGAGARKPLQPGARPTPRGPGSRVTSSPWARGATRCGIRLWLRSAWGDDRSCWMRPMFLRTPTGQREAGHLSLGSAPGREPLDPAASPHWPRRGWPSPRRPTAPRTALYPGPTDPPQPHPHPPTAARRAPAPQCADQDPRTRPRNESFDDLDDAPVDARGVSPCAAREARLP